jgi:AAA ATPase domain
MTEPPTPYRPGVSREPLYLADRGEHQRRFLQRLRAEESIVLTGPRGSGKSVLMQEYEKIAQSHEWAVVRLNLTASCRNEATFKPDLKEALQSLTEQLSLRKAKQDKATDFANSLEVELGLLGAKVRRTPGTVPRSLASILIKAIVGLGTLVEDSDKAGCLLLCDNGELLKDNREKGHYSLSSLIEAFIEASDEKGLPVALVLAGLPVLTEQVRKAASGHAERFFEPESVGYLSLTRAEGKVSPAALALINPASESPITFDGKAAEAVARDVKGYPYFLQLAGETLWLAAEREGVNVIDVPFYDSCREEVDGRLADKVYHGRWGEVRPADKETLAASGSFGGQDFTFDHLRELLPSRSDDSIQSSLLRLAKLGNVTQIRRGRYSYTVPGFGDYLRREHPLESLAF